MVHYPLGIGGERILKLLTGRGRFPPIFVQRNSGNEKYKYGWM